MIAYHITVSLSIVLLLLSATVYLVATPIFASAALCIGLVFFWYIAYESHTNVMHSSSGTEEVITFALLTSLLLALLFAPDSPAAGLAEKMSVTERYATSFLVPYLLVLHGRYQLYAGLQMKPVDLWSANNMKAYIDNNPCKKVQSIAESVDNMILSMNVGSDARVDGLDVGLLRERFISAIQNWNSVITNWWNSDIDRLTELVSDSFLCRWIPVLRRRSLHSNSKPFFFARLRWGIAYLIAGILIIFRSVFYTIGLIVQKLGIIKVISSSFKLLLPAFLSNNQISIKYWIISHVSSWPLCRFLLRQLQFGSLLKLEERILYTYIDTRLNKEQLSALVLETPLALVMYKLRDHEEHKIRLFLFIRRTWEQLVELQKQALARIDFVLVIPYRIHRLVLAICRKCIRNFISGNSMDVSTKELIELCIEDNSDISDESEMEPNESVYTLPDSVNPAVRRSSLIQHIDLWPLESDANFRQFRDSVHKSSRLSKKIKLTSLSNDQEESSNQYFQSPGELLYYGSIGVPFYSPNIYEALLRDSKKAREYLQVAAYFTLSQLLAMGATLSVDQENNRALDNKVTSGSTEKNDNSENHSEYKANTSMIFKLDLSRVKLLQNSYHSYYDDVRPRASIQPVKPILPRIPNEEKSRNWTLPLSNPFRNDSPKNKGEFSIISPRWLWTKKKTSLDTHSNNSSTKITVEIESMKTISSGNNFYKFESFTKTLSSPKYLSPKGSLEAVPSESLGITQSCDVLDKTHKLSYTNHTIETSGDKYDDFNWQSETKISSRFTTNNNEEIEIFYQSTKTDSPISIDSDEKKSSDKYRDESKKPFDDNSDLNQYFDSDIKSFDINSKAFWNTKTSLLINDFRTDGSETSTVSSISSDVEMEEHGQRVSETHVSTSKVDSSLDDLLSNFTFELDDGPVSLPPLTTPESPRTLQLQKLKAQDIEHSIGPYTDFSDQISDNNIRNSTSMSRAALCKYMLQRDNDFSNTFSSQNDLRQASLQKRSSLNQNHMAHDHIEVVNHNRRVISYPKQNAYSVISTVAQVPGSICHDRSALSLSGGTVLLPRSSLDNHSKRTKREHDRDENYPRFDKPYHFRTNFLITLAQSRVHDLTIEARAAVIHSLQIIRFNVAGYRLAERLVRNIFLNTYCEELTKLKELCDSKGQQSPLGLNQLLFCDIVTPVIREDILLHFEIQATLSGATRSINSNYYRAPIVLDPLPSRGAPDFHWLYYAWNPLSTNMLHWTEEIIGRKVLCDVDDTLECSGGLFPAGVDTRFKRHEWYPGVAKFLQELDGGSGSQCNHSYFEHKRTGSIWGRSNVTLLSARPHLYKHISEYIILRKFEQLKTEGRISFTPSILVGNLGAGTKYMMYGSLRPIANQKLKGFRNYLRLFPEYHAIFIGDTGQADLFVGVQMLLTNPQNVEVCFLHEVTPVEDAFGYEELENLPEILQKRIIIFRNYAEASVKAYCIGLIGLASLGRILSSAVEDLGNIKWSSSIAIEDINKIYSEYNRWIEIGNYILQHPYNPAIIPMESIFQCSTKNREN